MLHFCFAITSLTDSGLKRFAPSFSILFRSFVRPFIVDSVYPCFRSQNEYSMIRPLVSLVGFVAPASLVLSGSSTLAKFFALPCLLAPTWHL